MHKKAKTGIENSNNNNASVLPKEATEPTDFQMRLKDMESRVKLLESELTNVKSAVTSLEKNQAIFQGDEVIAFYTNDTQEEVDFDSYEIIEFQYFFF